MLIANYGLFWKIEDVFWGRPNNSGALYGYRRNIKEVDFSQQIGIYVLYADYKIVYIGQTGSNKQRLFNRLKQHREDHLSGRWNQFSWFGLKRVKNNHELSKDKISANTDTEGALNHIEAVLIYAAEPPLNRQGGIWRRETKLFYQLRDKKLGPPVNEMVEKIYKDREKKK